MAHCVNCLFCIPDAYPPQYTLTHPVFPVILEGTNRLFKEIHHSKERTGHHESDPGKRHPHGRFQNRRHQRSVSQVKTTLDRCFIAIQALHGMRPCEVLGLKWGDIDLDAGIIHIRRNVVHPTRNLPVVGDTKTKLSKRDVAISQIAMPYIQEASALFYQKGHYLFGGAEPLSYTQHRQMMARITKQMGLSGFLVIPSGILSSQMSMRKPTMRI